MKLKNLIEERNALIEKLQQIQNPEQDTQAKDYKLKIANLDNEIKELLENVPNITFKDFNDMLKEIFKRKYNIDADLKIVNHAFTDKDEKRLIDFILCVKRENDPSFDNFTIARQPIRRNFIASSSKFLVKLDKFFLSSINVADKSHGYGVLVSKYPEIIDVLLEIISNIKTTQLENDKNYLVRMIEKKKQELNVQENPDFASDIEEGEQEINEINDAINSWKL